MNKLDKTDLKFRQVIGIIRSVTDSITSSTSSIAQGIESIKNNVFKVEVTNSDPSVLLEVAKNTRGLKGAIQSAFDTTNVVEAIKAIKGGDTTINIPSDFKLGVKDVTIANTVSTKVENIEDLAKAIKFPEIPAPKSEVTVKNLSDIKFPEQKVDILPLVNALGSLKSVVSSINDQLPGLKQKEVKFPKLEMPKQMSIKEAGEIVKALSDGLQGVRDDLGEVYKAIENIDINVTGGGSGGTVVSSARVTDVNINALRGVPKSTAITVSTSVTQLPATNLKHRKSLQVYNASDNDIYIGGSDVTVSNGFPVPPASYSPTIDAGESMKVYAIASSNSAVRVLEVSGEQEGA